MSSFSSKHIGINKEQEKQMLNCLGIDSIDQLISETIPKNIRLNKGLDLDEALTENEKKQILVIRFEDFILNTYDHVKKIADFLETEETKATKEAIKYQGCPRIQNMDKKIKKFENIKKEASTKYLHLLDEMIEDYKTDWN